MLRTLAINSNQIVLSFGVLIAFWSPKQSKIEESSLESISKSRIQGIWDPAHYTRMPPHYIRLPPHYIRLQPHYTRMPPHYIWLQPHYTRLLPHYTRTDIPHLEFCPGDVPPSPSVSHPADISGSADSAHPEDFAAILHSAAVFSWSFLICATDIFRYLSLDIFL